jgi:WD40 repeat protein
MIAHYLILTYKLLMTRVLSLLNWTNLAYIISAWRDHSVLVHAGHDTWQLFHSLNNHRLGVNYARFHVKRKFITTSLDRTVVIYQLEDSGESSGVQTIRTINLARAHAVDVELASDSTLIISTSDRQVLMYDITSGDLVHAYKTADSSELITLGNIGLSKTLTFPPLMKVKALGSPVPQGQIRLRSLLAGAGNDKVSLPSENYLCSLFVSMIMKRAHYCLRSGLTQKV